MGTVTIYWENQGRYPCFTLGRVSQLDDWMDGTNSDGHHFAYDDNGQVTTEFTYDAHGRLSERSVEINQQEYTATYEWRFGDKLKRIDSTIPGETPVVQYNYDGLGKRRIKVANGHTTWWRWGLGWDPVTQYDEDDDDWAVEGFDRFFVPYGHTALAEADVTTTPANAAYNYLGPDHLGTGRSLFNQTKTAVGATEHLPYGNRYAQTGTAPYHDFTGKPWDGESGMYYFPFRYYAPDAGRWIEPDPLGPVAGLNEYLYANGNAVRLPDPLGLKPGDGICNKYRLIWYCGMCAYHVCMDIPSCSACAACILMPPCPPLVCLKCAWHIIGTLWHCERCFKELSDCLDTRQRPL